MRPKATIAANPPHKPNMAETTARRHPHDQLSARDCNRAFPRTAAIPPPNPPRMKKSNRPPIETRTGTPPRSQTCDVSKPVKDSPPGMMAIIPEIVPDRADKGLYGLYAVLSIFGLYDGSDMA